MTLKTDDNPLDQEFREADMTVKKKKVSSGVKGLDRMLNSLFIGDNVLWYDDAGSLASEFCLKFIQESDRQNKPIVYVSFDRSPKNLIEKLGSSAASQHLTILDCFTNGKGDQAEVFNKFYEKDGGRQTYNVIKVARPGIPQSVSDAMYGLHKTLSGDVRFVFESLTGMSDLWEGEENIIKFYSHTCPQLYELDTIAYWIIEKGAHSQKLKAHINQIAQVAIDLSIHQGKTRITILKAENRSPDSLGKASDYTCHGDRMMIRGDKDTTALYDLGSAIKNFRKTQGMSQKELSRLVGVTPSNISQIESNQVFPSIPALYRLAGHLSVDVGSFFKRENLLKKVIFPLSEGIPIKVLKDQKDRIQITQLTPVDLEGRIELFLIKILPGKRQLSHFFRYKGEEAGFLLAGEVSVVYRDQPHHLKPQDTIYLKTDSPAQWQNNGKETARLLWIKIR